MKRLILILLLAFPLIVAAQYRVSLYVVPDTNYYDALPHRTILYDLESKMFYRVESDFRTLVPIPGTLPEGAVVDSIFFEYSEYTSDLTGWYNLRDTVRVDSSLWSFEADVTGDFIEEDFVVEDFLTDIFGRGIYNKSEERVTITNHLYLQDTVHFAWFNPDAYTGLIVKPDGVIDTAELLEKAWKLWCDTSRVDSLLLLYDPPYADQLYHLTYDPVSKVVFYYDNVAGGGGDSSKWIRLNEHIYPYDN